MIALGTRFVDLADDVDPSAFWLYPDWEGPIKEPFWMRPPLYPRKPRPGDNGVFIKATSGPGFCYRDTIAEADLAKPGGR